ncbi:MAG: hypothetical protein Kow0077_31820 [Anaerolineae bacterium]
MIDLDSSVLSHVAPVLERMRAERVVARIWAHDHTVWKPEPTEITNRLGWLNLHETMRQHLPEIDRLVQSVVGEGFEQVLLLGMGGSSLAPEVFSRMFTDPEKRRLDLMVLDSTHPDAVRATEAALDLSKTLFIVSTKSGGTVETLSFFKYFYNRMQAIVGPARAGQHFVAITDPGSKLADLAEAHGFRATFLNDPNVGGRFSALSLVGLVPAALVGVDLDRLLATVAPLAEACHADDPADNPGALLGAVLGWFAEAGRNKLTLAISPELASLGDWIEQLVAESTGKEGKGILPVVGETPGDPDVYGNDRVFVALLLDDDSRFNVALARLESGGHPVIRIDVSNRYDIARQFWLWEFATAVAGYVLRINPFDQPNVESAKVRAREAVKAFQQTGRLPDVEALAPDVARLTEFLKAAQPGDYIALQAYVPANEATSAALQALRLQLRDSYALATTVGYGPRFLHSTGQLHKGDDGSGLFVQLVNEPVADVPIPDEAGQPGSTLTFGTLIRAQANGDRAALLDAGRRVIRFDLGSDVVRGLQALTD